jgi:DNA-binding phage protein
MSRKASQGPEVIFQSGDDLRGLLVDLIDASGQTRYAIAKASGLPESTLSRAYNGKATTTLETLAAVARATGRRVIVRVV